jgi:hypothetical protein
VVVIIIKKTPLSLSLSSLFSNSLYFRTHTLTAYACNPISPITLHFTIIYICYVLTLYPNNISDDIISYSTSTFRNHPLIHSTWETCAGWVVLGPCYRDLHFCIIRISIPHKSKMIMRACSFFWPDSRIKKQVEYYFNY